VRTCVEGVACATKSHRSIPRSASETRRLPKNRDDSTRGRGTRTRFAHMGRMLQSRTFHHRHTTPPFLRASSSVQAGGEQQSVATPHRP
jgi:hypothetical protein